MKKYITVLSSFMVMLCLGGIYAWSIIASELINNHNFSSTQTQIIFGSLIAVFPATMIFVGKLAAFISARKLGYISGVLFISGYLSAGLSGDNAITLWFGIGLLSGIATGFGYWVSLTIPVQWFPERKGLVTGIVSAGFGLGAVILSSLAEGILSSGRDVFQLLVIIGISYGVIISFFSSMITEKKIRKGEGIVRTPDFRTSDLFRKLLLGMFLGTFAGLLVIGSLKLIGTQFAIHNHILVLGVSLFAVANFLGRLIWGYLSDHLGASITIFYSLLFQSIGIILLNLVVISNVSFILLSLLIGLGFGGNFVLFAKETAQFFGVSNLGTVYPYVFLGYAVAGIFGPLSGGLLFDLSGSYTLSIYLAGAMSLCGGLLYLVHFLKTRREDQKIGKNR